MEISLSYCQQILQPYGLGSIHRIERMQKGYSSLNYKVSSAKGDFLLKTFLGKSQEDVEYEMALFKLLEAQQFPAAYPVQARDGSFILENAFGKMALFDFLEGEEPAINKAVIIAIAEALPQLHAIEDWKHHEALRQDSYIQFSKCLDLIEQFQKAKYQYPKLFQDFKKHTLLHQDILTVDLPKGLIHGDLFPDNTIFQGDTLIGFLDFEDAGMAPLLVDIAMTINGFCFEENRLQADRMAIFLDAYNSIRPIRTLEAKWLMKHIRASILMLIRWHLSCIMEKPRERSLQRAQYLMKRLEMLG